MYNGIGLRTVRGSGTNGFVQRNRSYVAPPPPQQLTHAQQRDVQMRAQLQITKKANGEMLEHERKRRIEIKVAEFEEQLRSRNFSEEEIEQKCQDARIALTEQMKHTADEINLRDSHQASAAKEKENARLRAAFGIREDRPAGAAFAAMNDKGKKGEEKDAPTEDKPLRLPRSYLDRTIEKREGEEEEDQENPRRKRQRSRSPQREGQGQQRERERERGGRDTEDGDRRYDRDRRDVDRGDRGDYGERDRIRRTDDRDRRDRRDERSYDNRDRRDRRDIDEDRYRPRERSPSPFDGQPKMRDDGRDEGEPRSVIVAEPEPEQEQAETKKEAEKGEEGDKQEKKSHEKKREREREKEKEKDKDKGKDKSSSRSKKRSKRSNSDSDSSSSSSSSDSDSDSSSSSDSDDDRRKKDSKRKRSPSQD